MPNNELFEAYSYRAWAARPCPLFRVTYTFTQLLPGDSENWFFAHGVPGWETGWAYLLEFAQLPHESQSKYLEYLEQTRGFSLSLSGAKAEVEGRLPSEILPWVQHQFSSCVIGPWGWLTDVHAAIALEDLKGADWLSTAIVNERRYPHGLQQAKGF